MTQEEFDNVGRRIVKLQKKYGVESEELERIKLSYILFTQNKIEYFFNRLKEEVDKVEAM